MAKKNKSIANRVGMVDEIRGLSILLTIFYHAGYDLVFIYGLSIPFFTSYQMNLLRDFFAGVFIFISGAACRFSRNNLKRGVFCFLIGMGLTLFTWVFMPEQIILFGILHMLGLSMILFHIMKNIFNKLRFPIIGIAICAFLYWFTMTIENGYLGPFALPYELYDISWLFPIGITSSGFFSSDYFPLFPWFFVFLSGSYFGIYITEKRLPNFFYNTHIKPLAFVGRHTLWIYLLQQPVIYLVFTLIFRFV